MSKKVFLGLNNTAGVLTRLKAGFTQNGIDSDFYSFNEHIFGYETDLLLKYSRNRLSRVFQKTSLIFKLLIKYKYFIFDSSSTLLPAHRDIKIFRMFGKKCMMIFTGCDIRLPKEVEKYKWNPCRDCTNEYKSFVGCVIDTKPEMIRMVEKNFDIIVSAEEAAGSLSRKYHPALFPVDLEKFTYTGVNPGRKLKILHAPSNPEYKGTGYILDAIEKLKGEFEFEFKIVNNVTAEELYKEIEKTDLVIDQMLVGFYGLLSIESMAMGKPVVCYIREDISAVSPEEMPVINANPDNLYEVLKKILLNPSELIDAGIRSREYVEKYHNAKFIAKQYFGLLERTI
ncbi:MAG: hypothetical protein HOP31_13415 [Ignavibacteria bacterium]|nr:hypothetical protein [Ignavibacteria bacterium]